MRHARHPDVHLVLHGHFYQPPRENPWTGEVPRQPGAAPFHDWNERILAECYRPNTASRVLDPFGRVRRIVNNLEHLSFNFGPTLLEWMAPRHPDVYARILEADRRSRASHDGQGNALAQVYHHVILPLASDRDRRTQIRWGLRDFERRFGRAAAGMWLSETAIDTATARDLTACGVRFTILAPGQARRIRPLAGGDWRDVRGARIDPRRPYRICHPDGSHLDVFFYDGHVSQSVAFEGLLRDADRFAERLALAVEPGREEAQIVSLAVDGETFGHHEAFGDMCLAAFFATKAAARGFRLTNYAAYLERFPPQWEVELETGEDGRGTAWSCAHGVGRWYRDCGCSTGAAPEWNQAWRGPLRAALDTLRDGAAECFEVHGQDVLRDPWAARDAYVDVLVDPEDRDRRETFLAAHLRRPDDPSARVQALALLESQRHAMAMYTSCAWFFADVSGIETIQNLRYAARCLQLLHPFGGAPLRRRFLKQLEAARSNLDADTARTLYARIVEPEVSSVETAVGARGLERLLEASTDGRPVLGYHLEELGRRPLEVGGRPAVFGRTRAEHRHTEERADCSWLAVRWGARDVRCLVAPFDPRRHAGLVDALPRLGPELPPAALERKLLQLHGGTEIRVRDLLEESRRWMAERLAADVIDGLHHHYRAVYEESLHLLEDFAEMELELPEALQVPCTFTLQDTLERRTRRLRPPYRDTHAVEEVVATARRLRLTLDLAPAARWIEAHLLQSVRELQASTDVAAFDAIDPLLQLADRLGVGLDLTLVQETLYEEIARRFHDGAEPAAGVMLPEKRAGDAGATRPSAAFERRLVELAERLNFAVEAWDLPAVVAGRPTP